MKGLLGTLKAAILVKSYLFSTSTLSAPASSILIHFNVLAAITLLRPFRSRVRTPEALDPQDKASTNINRALLYLDEEKEKFI